MSDQPTGGGELTHFEQLSAITPKTMPLAIIIGALMIGPLLILINLLAPTEAVDELKGDDAKKDTAAEVQPAGGGGGEVDDI